MSFVSVAFAELGAFVLLVRILLNWIGNHHGLYLRTLLLFGIVFYAWYRPEYLLVLLIPASLDFIFAKLIHFYFSNYVLKRTLLVCSLSMNLGILFFFKYFNFFFSLLGSQFSVDLELPLGISFFTFQSMSYTIDVYRGVIQPVKKFEKFLLFVSFFPQMVAGPIVRAKELFYQFDRRRRIQSKVWAHGLFLILSGLFLKVVLADHLAGVVNKYWDIAYGADSRANFSGSLALLFSGQIFCDFAGYSNMARGIAYLLGFRLPINFDFPYIAPSFSNFWQRWHMTLSQWLRDYLYISLGGNRVSKWRIYLNLMLVMLIGGFWHGASLCFIVWGGIHGLALIIERGLGFNQKTESSPVIFRFGWYLVVQVTVMIAWIFFRTDTLQHGLRFVSSIFRGHWNQKLESDIGFSFLFLVPVVLMHFRKFLMERDFSVMTYPVEVSIASGLMIYLLLTTYAESTSSFIYFHF